MTNIKKKQEAIELLKKVIGDKCGPIKSIKQIHKGYTNVSFVVLYEKGHKFQVRLPHCGDLINRSAEQQILNILNDKSYVYFDVKTGNAIKAWIPGKCPKIHRLFKWPHIDKLFIMIRQLHSVPLERGHRFRKIDLDQYNDNLYRLRLNYQTKYLSLVDRYRDDPAVFNHTDINPENMILDTKNVLHLIDFEWCGLVSDYWDYANFIREAEILWYEQIDWKKYIPKFDLYKLKDYIFMACIYSYLWTWKMPQTRRIKKYRRKVINQIRIYSRGVITNEK